MKGQTERRSPLRGFTICPACGASVCAATINVHLDASGASGCPALRESAPKPSRQVDGTGLPRQEQNQKATALGALGAQAGSGPCAALKRPAPSASLLGGSLPPGPAPKQARLWPPPKQGAKDTAPAKLAAAFQRHAAQGAVDDDDDCVVVDAPLGRTQGSANSQQQGLPAAKQEPADRPPSGISLGCQDSGNCAVSSSTLPPVPRHATGQAQPWYLRPRPAIVAHGKPYSDGLDSTTQAAPLTAEDLRRLAPFDLVPNMLPPKLANRLLHVLLVRFRENALAGGLRQHCVRGGHGWCMQICDCIHHPAGPSVGPRVVCTGAGTWHRMLELPSPATRIGAPAKLWIFVGHAAIAVQCA